ncbi:MAG: hypothetical protein DRM98_00415 [Thermoplasmata archaeon]|nr:MAG: hypothetical protein DRM98_00415 [Thermoplasmata archaeon]
MMFRRCRICGKLITEYSLITGIGYPMKLLDFVIKCPKCGYKYNIRRHNGCPICGFGKRKRMWRWG